MDKEKPSDRTKNLIDASLRRVFAEQTEEELPDRFKELLAQLQGGKPSGSGKTQQ